MTNHWVDMLNADVVLIMGGNPAEDHPIAMNWLTRAKERGAYILHVDPRFNRTSSIADVFAKLRSGTDIAFVGGMIHYAIAHNRLQQEYVREYTNASWIVGDDYSFTDGLFAGYDPTKRSYDRTRWAYALDAQGRPQRDPTLEHPRCVFQLLKQHFSRYDAETVCRITGTPQEQYLRVCDLYTSTFAPDRAGTWLYAMGTAQHSHGTQNIRSYAILQLLLGNIGVAGGGVNAMRGESNVQGSTDQGLNYDGLPGYLRLPVEADADLQTYLSRVTPISYDPSNSANWLQNTPKYVASLLKAWWGEHATREHEFACAYLPKLGHGFQGQDYAFLALTHAMLAGEIKGLFCFGQNPAVGAILSATWFALSFWIEIGFGLLLPFVLLLLPEVRESRRGLATACGLVVAGVLLHRLNVAVIGLRVRHWESYIPSLGEIAITLGITAGTLFAFGWLARILPIHAELPSPQTSPHPATQSTSTLRSAEGAS
jgi:formate dehydrogenase major subunit